MANLVNLFAEAGASLIADDNETALHLENTGTGAALSVKRVGAGNSTIGVLRLSIGSVASGAVFALRENAFVSAVSIVFAAGASWAGLGVMRVVRTDGTFGWIPILPDGVVTAAAA